MGDRFSEDPFVPFPLRLQPGLAAGRTGRKALPGLAALAEQASDS